MQTFNAAGLEDESVLPEARACLEGLRALVVALSRGVGDAATYEVGEAAAPPSEPAAEQDREDTLAEPVASVSEAKLQSAPPAADVLPAKKRKSVTRKRLAEKVERWFTETRSVPDQTDPDATAILNWKRLVCEGRMLLVGLEELEMDTDPVEAELRTLQKAFNALGGRGSFFGFNRRLKFTYGSWEVLSRALAAANSALRTANLLRTGADLLKENERLELCADAVSAAQWAKEVLAKNAEVGDMHVNEAVQSAEAIAEKLILERRPGVGTRNPSSRIAAKLIDNVAMWETTIPKRKEKRDAERVIEQASKEELVVAIRQAIQRGLPASNQILLRRAKEVKDQLSPENDAAVIKYLEEREARASNAKSAMRGAMKPVNPEYLRKVEAVKPFCAGKVVVVLGGKRKNEHAEQYREVIGFADVIWPDTERSTKPSTLEPLVMKGDIVVYNPQFSRHAYKRVIDRATQAGKCVIVLDHGYGVEQLVHCAYEQLDRRGYIT